MEYRSNEYLYNECVWNIIIILFSKPNIISVIVIINHNVTHTHIHTNFFLFLCSHIQVLTVKVYFVEMLIQMFYKDKFEYHTTYGPYMFIYNSCI